jgi:hypothetical protein
VRPDWLQKWRSQGVGRKVIADMFRNDGCVHVTPKSTTQLVASFERVSAERTKRKAELETTRLPHWSDVDENVLTLRSVSLHG